MDLDELKKSLQKATPRESQITSGGVESLLARLRAMEAVEQARLKKARVLYAVTVGIFAFVFVVLCLVPSAVTHASRIVHQGVLLVAFSVVLLSLRQRIVALARVDYSQPVKAFLEGALRLHRLGPATWGEYAVAIVGLIVLWLSGGYVLYEVYFTRLDSARVPMALGLYTLGFVGVVVMGCYFTWKNWQRDKGAVVEEIRRLQPPSAADGIKEPAAGASAGDGG